MEETCVCMSLELKALASWQHFTIALHVHTHVLWRFWGALSQLTVMAHNSLMPYSCKWERILMWTTLVFPPNLFCLWRETFFVVETIPWERIGKLKETLFWWEFSSYWMIFIFPHFPHSKSCKMKEEISQMKWCGLVILGVYSTSLQYIYSQPQNKM